jgi:hypothetical protein
MVTSMRNDSVIRCILREFFLKTPDVTELDKAQLLTQKINLLAMQEALQLAATFSPLSPRANLGQAEPYVQNVPEKEVVVSFIR